MNRPKHCQNCGTLLLADAAHCTGCGTPLSVPPTATRARKPWWVAGGLLALAGVSIGGVWAAQNYELAWPPRDSPRAPMPSLVASAPPSVPAAPMPFVEPVMVHAAAPDGIGDFSLGQTFSSSMVPLGVVVFANDAPHQHQATINRFEHETVTIDSDRALRANASAWHIVSAEVGAQTSERYMSHRAFQIAYTLEIDANTLTATPPPSAVYYLARISYGHLYESVVHGDANTFHAGLTADFGVGNGSIEGWARDHHLQFEARGVGMTARDGGAIFAHNEAEIEQGYETSEPAVPIFVDYRSLPSIAPPAETQIAWRQPLRVRVLFDNLDISDNGSVFGGATWSLGAACTVNSPRPAMAEPFFSGRVDAINRIVAPRRYETEWSHDLAVVLGDEIQCGVVGSQDDVAIPYSGFVLTVTDPIAPVRASFPGTDPHTAFRVNYRVVPLP